MNILHTVDSLDETTGGPARSVTSLVFSLNVLNTKCSILTHNSSNPVLDKSTTNISFSSPRTLTADIIRSINSGMELIHTHGIWLKINNTSAYYARQKRIPYIISPRGMLEPWSLQQGSLKKKVAMLLFQRKDLQNAACIHATAISEAKNIRALDIKTPIAVIPNGINLTEFPFPYTNSVSEHKTLLFLSRIHPKKGIELLVEAWKNLKPEIKHNWVVEIAGNGEQSYINTLQQSITNVGLEKEIKIIGSQFGPDKLKAYQRASLFVLPTYSENFGIVVAEALACGVPVITTNGTPWQELNDTKSGWCIDLSIEKLTNTLEHALRLKKEELDLMGQNGRKLVENNYSIESVAIKMKELYEWILHKTDKPEFIILD